MNKLLNQVLYVVCKSLTEEGDTLSITHVNSEGSTHEYDMEMRGYHPERLSSMLKEYLGICEMGVKNLKITEKLGGDHKLTISL